MQYRHLGAIIGSVLIHLCLLAIPIREAFQSFASNNDHRIPMILQSTVVKATATTPRLPSKEKKAAPEKQNELTPAMAEETNSAPTSQEISVSDMLHYESPHYPRMALARGLEGELLLELWVAEDGRTERALITQSSGHEMLDQSALTAAKTWRFGPSTPRKIALIKRVVFQIED
jgi:protein TonB